MLAIGIAALAQAAPPRRHASQSELAARQALSVSLPGRIQLGWLLAEIGRLAKLTDEAHTHFERVHDPSLARAVDVECSRSTPKRCLRRGGLRPTHGWRHGSTRNLAIRQNKHHREATMKDGKFHKAP